MILWTKKKINKTRIIENDLSVINLDTQLEAFAEEPKIESSNLFAALVPAPVTSLQSGCSYPLDIANHFPLWATLKTDPDLPNLVDFTQAYFNWLTCGTQTNITPEIGFFELENLKRINLLSKQLLLLHSELYIPSLPKRALEEDVSVEELKILLNGIYNKLYVRKGSEYSFRYLISLLFNVPSNNINIIYPKRYLMLLNSGTNKQLNGISPSNTVGRLNYSVLKDNTIWNEYSYVINIKKEGEYVRRDRFQNLIRPLLHPIGLKDFYQEQEQLLSAIKEVTSTKVVEVPKIVNYYYYDLNSDTSIEACQGCTLDSAPSFVFPDWTQKIPNGVTFGVININEFWELTPRINDNFPNNSITCTGC